MDHLRVASGSPICRIPSGVWRLGSTQHPRDATRERCADEWSPSGDCECAASGPSIMYAGDRGRREGSELEPPATLFGALAGSRRRPFGDTTRFVDTERLRVRGTTRWIFPSGWIYWHPTVPSGPMLGCGRDVLPSGGCIGAERDRSRSSLRGRVERNGAHQPSGWKRPSPASRRPSGRR